MLAADEFTVGKLGDALPGSLILPRTKYEAAVLIGQLEAASAAVFLTAPHRFKFFLSAGNTHWGGLIVPDVKIELDETSLFDPDYDGSPLGSVIRMDTRLVVRAITERSFGHASQITLRSDLAPILQGSAAFSRWQVVIGEGRGKRVLFSVDASEIEEAQA